MFLVLFSVPKTVSCRALGVRYVSIVVNICFPQTIQKGLSSRADSLPADGSLNDAVGMDGWRCPKRRKRSGIQCVSEVFPLRTDVEDVLNDPLPRKSAYFPSVCQYSYALLLPLFFPRGLFRRVSATCPVQGRSALCKLFTFFQRPAMRTERVAGFASN